VPVAGIDNIFAGDTRAAVKSATGIPSSTCFNATTIYSTEKRFLFTTNSYASTEAVCRKN
jgi:hypothetical protein